MFELIHRKLDLINKKLDLLMQRQQIETKDLNSLREMEKRIMATVDDLVTEVAKEKDEIASVKTFIQGLQQQIADALAGVSLPPATQAKVDAVFAQMQANSTDLADAITTPGSGG